MEDIKDSNATIQVKKLDDIVVVLCTKYFVNESLLGRLEVVGNESGVKIKCLRLDKGGEFTSNEFNMLCKGNGIK